MTYCLALTEQADSDLRGIYEYIAFSLLEPENAVRQLDRLEENISTCAVRFYNYTTKLGAQIQ